MKRLISGTLMAGLLMGACRKKPDPVEPHSPQMLLSFENVVNGKPLVLDSANYTNTHGDAFTVSSYLYYISNIELLREDGTAYTEFDSYHLVNEKEPASKKITLDHIPPGRYTSVSFLIGIDSARNVSGAQTGDLDPSKTMFWSWNTGYIMARVEGTSPQAKWNMLAFHLGGFSGKYNSTRKVTLQLKDGVNIGENERPVVNIASDVAEWFKTPAVIDFSKLAIVSIPGEEAKTIADNYMDMFTVVSIQQ